MNDLPMNVAIDTDKKELKVIYAVRQVEVGFSGISYSKSKNFDSLRDAIDYHSRQANTPYTWHEIRVEYYYNELEEENAAMAAKESEE